MAAKPEAIIFPSGGSMGSANSNVADGTQEISGRAKGQG